MKRKFFTIAAYLAAFFITTGMIIPWLISNDVLPMPLIIVCGLLLGIVWATIMEKPVIRLLKWANKKFEDTNQ